ncbi:hypothetical protein D917_01480 [Trichinella nativa]|nr:hypothetical protein D917_01480 [Trichinella nativa]
MIKKPETRKALVIGCAMQMFQQLSGINTVMYYSASIVQMGGVRSRTMAIWMAAVTSGFNFFCTFIGIYLVERVGRRKVLLGSTLGVVLSLLVLGIGFTMISVDSPVHEFDEMQYDGGKFADLAILDPCRGLGCDACSYQESCGFCYDPSSPSSNGSCVSTYSAVVNGHHVESNQWANYGRCARKDFSSPLTSETIQLAEPSTQFDYGYCITKYSWIPILAMAIYLCCFSVGAFFLYAAISAIGMILFYLIVPETKGISIEDIEILLRGSWIYNEKKAKKVVKARNSKVHPVDIVINTVAEEAEKTTRF